MTQWTQPKKPFAWSFSALKNYETCPKKYFHENIAKDVKEETTSTGDWGSLAHKAIERRILQGTKFGLGMTHFEPMIAAFIAAPGDTYAERKMAVDRDYRPVEYFDKTVWLRGQGDAFKIQDAHAAILDWKFGKYRDDWQDQGLIMARVTMALMAEIQTVRASFIYFAEMQPGGLPLVVGHTYTRENITGPWTSILPRVARMEAAYGATDYPARQNGLCRKYCPVRACPFNGR